MVVGSAKGGASIDDVDVTIEGSSAGYFGDEAPGRALAPGARVGRYVVLGELGSGAMGVILRAHDPELDREVALKLVRFASAGTEASAGQARLLREAQALAKLAHPNVVAVHDVGTHEQGVYVAMELIEGANLRAWLARESPGWRQVCEVFEHAGRGLAAAHGRGLVHRDFKPDNVMIGKDDRVRVVDFGLARPTAAREELDVRASAAESAGSAAEAELTRAGSRLGTPAYMAPEQHLGLPADARSDQFSFAVALWEALYGERPYAGATVAALVLAVTQGELREPSRASAAPRWLRRIVARALAVDPSARYPDMAAFLSELTRGRSRARARRLGLTLTGIAAVAAVAVGGARLAEARELAACGERSAAMTEVWPARAADVAAALRATGSPLADDTVARISPRLDAYAERWGAAAVDRCERGVVGDPVAVQLAPHSESCLEIRRAALAHLVDRLERTDAATLPLATGAVAALPRVEDCVDEDALRRSEWPSAGLLAQVTALRGRATEVGVLRVTGHVDEALAKAGELRGEAEALGWAPLAAELGRSLGVAQTVAGDYPGAQASLEEAYFVAGRAGADGLAGDCAVSLVWLGYERSDLAGAHAWARHAEVMLARAGGRPLSEADLTDALANVAMLEGDLASARQKFAEVLALRERELGPDDPLVTTTLVGLAGVEWTAGDGRAAVDYYERVLARLEQLLGPDNPQLGRHLTAAGEGYRLLGDLDAAERLQRRALATVERVLGADHPDVAYALNNLAALEFDRGRRAEARRDYERAIEVGSRTLGEDHPAVATMISNLAEVVLAEGDPVAAEQLYRRARAGWEASVGPDHVDMGVAWLGIGNSLIAQGRLDEAREPLERAVALRADREVSALERGQAQSALGRALWPEPAQRGRAVALLLAARANLESAGQQGEASARELEAFLAAATSGDRATPPGRRPPAGGEAGERTGER